MKQFIIYTIILLSSMTFNLREAKAQLDPEKVCRIDNGQLIFTLNLKWTDAEKKEVMELFELDSVLMVKVFSGATTVTLGNETWKARKTGANIIELSKLVQTSGDPTMKANDLFLIIDNWMDFSGNVTESEAAFGANNFEVANAFVYSSGIARFYLPGEKSAKKVFISGTFNNWSTSQTPMKFMGNGWMIDLKLSPGKYAYKFIVDGRWKTDPSNRLRERGGAGSDNSVVYCPDRKSVV